MCPARRRGWEYRRKHDRPGSLVNEQNGFISCRTKAGKKRGR